VKVWMLLSLWYVLSGGTVRAGMRLELNGVVVGFDETTVTIESNGRRVVIPRRFITQEPLRPGLNVSAVFASPSELEVIRPLGSPNKGQ